MEGNRAQQHGLALGASLARAAGLLAAAGLSAVSILDPDLPWHLAAARRMVETRAVPRADFLSWTMAGNPWADFEWGSELAFYGLLRAGGTPALWLFRSAALVALVLMFLALLRAWRVPRSWEALAAPALAGALFPLYGMRPEIFSLLLFMLELHLLEGRRLGRLRLGTRGFLLLHLALYAVWANLHAGFAAGLLLCLCYGLGELFGRSEESVPVAALAAGAGFLGTFVNPYGTGLYVVLFDHWRHADLLRRLIVEWQPPSFFHAYLAGYWLIVAFSFGALLWAVRRGVPLAPEHVVAAAVFGFFGSRSIRTTAYAVVLLFPLGLEALARSSLSARARRGLALAALAAVPFVVWRGLTWAGDLRFVGWPAPMEAQGPEGAVDFLRREKAVLAGLKMYNPYNWGGTLGYALGPDGYKVFIDGRYPFAELLGSVDDAERSPRAFRAFVEREDVALAVQMNDGLMVRDASNPWHTAGRPYIAYEWPRVDWALVYWDSDALIYVRRDRAPKAWLKKHEYRLLRPHDLRQLALYLVAGNVRLRDVRDEIRRYRREIGDPGESAELSAWYERFTKDLPRRGAAGRS